MFLKWNRLMWEDPGIRALGFEKVFVFKIEKFTLAPGEERRRRKRDAALDEGLGNSNIMHLEKELAINSTKRNTDKPTFSAQEENDGP